MDDWIYLTYKLHDKLENMIVPEEKNKKADWHWVYYAAFLAFKLYYR